MYRLISVCTLQTVCGAGQQLNHFPTCFFCSVACWLVSDAAPAIGVLVLAHDQHSIEPLLRSLTNCGVTNACQGRACAAAALCHLLFVQHEPRNTNC